MITVLTAVLDIVLSMLGRDAWGWLPRLSRAVIWLQTAPLPKARRELRREEWHSELAAEYDDRRLTGFFWVLSLSRVSVWERLTTPIALRAERQRARLTAADSERLWTRMSLAAAVTGGLTGAAAAVTSVTWTLGPLRAALGAAGLARFAGLWLVIAACISVPVWAWISRRRREIALARRRVWVLDVLASLGHASDAQSIRALRTVAREDGLFDEQPASPVDARSALVEQLPEGRDPLHALARRR